MGTQNVYRRRHGFTIVELIVVISVISILAAIVIFSIGAWQNSTRQSSIKNDLNAAAASMEAARNFTTGYPVSIPSSFSPSEGVQIDLASVDDLSFCIDGTHTQNTAIVYYIDETLLSQGAQEGTCATRVAVPVPGSPANVAFVTTGASQIDVSWTPASPNYATGYIAQCAQDPAFIVGPIQATVSGAGTTSANITGATALTSYYCRVRASNAVGVSTWSNTSQSGDTNDYICSDFNQYGTYPDCYDYDSLAVGASIAGYWTTPPEGYLLEDGSAVSRTTYADLFALIGTTYGIGNGSTTFNLPDSRGRATVNTNSADAEFNTVGETYGEKTHTFTVGETPSHSHVQNVTANSGGPAVRNDYSGEPNSAGYPQGINTAGAGSSSPANVIQPSIVKQYAIKWRPSTGSNSTLSPGTTIQGYWTSSPSGYTHENGVALSRATYAELFSIIGTTYGAGDGSTTFTMPNSQGRVGVNKNPSDTQFDVLGETYGEKTHTLTISEMVSHSHVQYVTANSGGSAVRNDYGSDAAGQAYSQGQSTGGAGSGQAFNVIQPSIAKRSTIKVSAAAGTQADAGIIVGTSIEGWWTSAPSGFLLEDGSAVSRTTYSALFALIGTTYGAGNGSTTFNLPDSRGRVAVNKNSADTQFDVIGEKFGEKTHIMSLAELASHSHAQYVTAGNGSNPWRNDYKSDAAGGTYAQNISTNGTGGSAAYNVIQPSITKTFAIKF